MRIDLMVHILAGVTGIVTGFIALFAIKGGTLHRRSGMVFVYAMVVMGVVGALIAAVRHVAPQSNVPAGVLCAYLVITGMVTVRRPAGWSRRMDAALMMVALSVTLGDFAVGYSVLTRTNPRLHWLVVPASIMGLVALSAAVGDLRIIRAGPAQGRERLARHLWRMSFAMFIATSSFFLGQAKVFPKPIRIPGLLAIPVLVVLITMFYWMWRMRARRRSRGSIPAGGIVQAVS